MGGKNSGRRADPKRAAEAARLRARGLTLEAVGRELGVTRQAVHDLLKKSKRADAWQGLLCSACGKPLGRSPRLFFHPNGPAFCLVCLPADATFGQRLKSFRLTAGLSQRELAKRTGILSQSLSAYERDQVQPEWPNVEKLIKVFGVALVDMGKHFLDRPVADLGFSQWTDSLLARAGMRSIRHLRNQSAQALERQGFTAMPLREVRARLAEFGLTLAGE
jgi:transcriptional regulator with XRE-family HTH domain